MSATIQANSAKVSADGYRVVAVDLEFDDSDQQAAAIVELLQDLPASEAIKAIFEAFPEFEALLDADRSLDIGSDDSVAALSGAVDTLDEKRR